eukprot:scaffold300131_cov40-Tisochrysis_lutea.AAC.2
MSDNSDHQPWLMLGIRAPQALLTRACRSLGRSPRNDPTVTACMHPFERSTFLPILILGYGTCDLPSEFPGPFVP